MTNRGGTDETREVMGWSRSGRWPFALVVVLGLLPPACGDVDNRPLPARLKVVGEARRTGMAGKELTTPIEVLVLDANGGRVTGARVSFKVLVGGGTVYPAEDIATNGGPARTTWTLGNQAGLQQLEARLYEAGTGATLSFVVFEAEATLEVIRKVTAQWQPFGGQEKSGNVRFPLCCPIATVTDLEDHPLAGVAVRFVAKEWSGRAAPVSATTDADGHASTTWLLGDTLGQQDLEVGVDGAETALLHATGTGSAFDGFYLGTRTSTALEPPETKVFSFVQKAGVVSNDQAGTCGDTECTTVAVTCTTNCGGAITAIGATITTGANMRTTYTATPQGGPIGNVTLSGTFVGCSNARATCTCPGDCFDSGTWTVTRQ